MWYEYHNNERHTITSIYTCKPVQSTTQTWRSCICVTQNISGSGYVWQLSDTRSVY